jgi:hypothetical protein
MRRLGIPLVIGVWFYSVRNGRRGGGGVASGQAQFPERIICKSAEYS